MNAICAKFGPPGTGRFVFGSKVAIVAGFDAYPENELTFGGKAVDAVDDLTAGQIAGGREEGRLPRPLSEIA